MQNYSVISFDRIRPNGRFEGTAPTLEAAQTFVAYLREKSSGKEDYKNVVNTQFVIFEAMENQTDVDATGADLTDEQRERLAVIDASLAECFD